jgi:hypothetical protein
LTAGVVALVVGGIFGGLARVISGGLERGLKPKAKVISLTTQIKDIVNSAQQPSTLLTTAEKTDTLADINQVPPPIPESSTPTLTQSPEETSEPRSSLAPSNAHGHPTETPIEISKKTQETPVHDETTEQTTAPTSGQSETQAAKSNALPSVEVLKEMTLDDVQKKYEQLVEQSKDAPELRSLPRQFLGNVIKSFIMDYKTHRNERGWLYQSKRADLEKFGPLSKEDIAAFRVKEVTDWALDTSTKSCLQKLQESEEDLTVENLMAYISQYMDFNLKEKELLKSHALAQVIVYQSIQDFEASKKTPQEPTVHDETIKQTAPTMEQAETQAVESDAIPSVETLKKMKPDKIKEKYEQIFNSLDENPDDLKLISDNRTIFRECHCFIPILRHKFRNPRNMQMGSACFLGDF